MDVLRLVDIIVFEIWCWISVYERIITFIVSAANVNYANIRFQIEKWRETYDQPCRNILRKGEKRRAIAYMAVCAAWMQRKRYQFLNVFQKIILSFDKLYFLNVFTQIHLQNFECFSKIILSLDKLYFTIACGGLLARL